MKDPRLSALIHFIVRTATSHVSLIVSDSDLREAAKRQAVYVTSGMVTEGQTKLSIYGKR